MHPFSPALAFFLDLFLMASMSISSVIACPGSLLKYSAPMSISSEIIACSGSVPQAFFFLFFSLFSFPFFFLLFSFLEWLSYPPPV
ncbi:hypothetical protein BT67DRAFT_43818 [Trichocladium antarcticum]|uniref:NADH dehydrogenase subunit 1 n=1 Tax=Trichocladium antarcticum TaxID=1450529 RepID=A0AAN6UJ30_9PEZI|nr:hypothetical protein BT67DRAFT_43818 [Trichocladium antarcticum]